MRYSFLTDATFSTVLSCAVLKHSGEDRNITVLFKSVAKCYFVVQIKAKICYSSLNPTVSSAIIVIYDDNQFSAVKDFHVSNIFV